MKRLYIVAGEASGDLHASNVMKQLYLINPELNIHFWGGDKMQAVGGKLVKHYRELAFMGFVEVLKNIRTIFKNIRFCKEDILNFKPDAILLVDYPGFNMRIAAWAKENNIKVYYYISPTVWAWKEKRVEKIRRDVHKMFVILPFEKPFYAKHAIEVEYVGHPLMDAIENYHAEEKKTLALNTEDIRPIIAVLPGSRVQELKTKLPVMLSIAKEFPEYRFVIAAAPGIETELYKEILPNVSFELVVGNTYGLLEKAFAAIVTSGTATLETALFHVPQVVCYIGNPISIAIARKLVNIKYISLPNLILDKLSITELIQNDCSKENLTHELRKITKNQLHRSQVLEDYTILSSSLGLGGASKKVAEKMLLTE